MSTYVTADDLESYGHIVSVRTGLAVTWRPGQSTFNVWQHHTGKGWSNVDSFYVYPSPQDDTIAFGAAVDWLDAMQETYI